MNRKVKTQKPKRTKKVFRMWKFVASTNTMDKEHCQITADAFCLGWPQECEGKTLEQITSETDTCHLVMSASWFVKEKY